MTVIAWDGKTLAADRLGATCGLKRSVTKIRRIRGALCGASGDAHLALTLLKWLEAGAKPEEFPEDQRDEDKACTVICITPERLILSYWTLPTPVRLEDEFHAIGCGRDYAIATMHLGHDARKAVEVASLFDANCGNGIDTLEFE